MQLPTAYRSLSRPSSAPDAKAFTLCSFSLEFLQTEHILSVYVSGSHYSLNCLSFFKTNNLFGSLRLIIPLKGFPFALYFESSSTRILSDPLEIVFLPKFGKTKSLLFTRNNVNFVLFICSFYSSIYFIRFSMNVSRSFELLYTLSCTEWAKVDSNHRPRAYQARALTS